MRRMREEDIPAFVQEVAATGCDICAISPGHYVMGDPDVPRSRRRGLYKKLEEIDARYGNRDHLRDKIASHLASIGRYIDAHSVEAEAWTRFSTSDRKVDDEAPSLAAVTAYDVAHLGIYAALLVAEADRANWRNVARVTLNIDPKRDPERARRAWASHLARAHWLATDGLEGLRGDLLQ